ncbi:MAG: Ig-like domain-containing protein [Propionibacteriaceae bacterium]|jgi:hypothetical protein|nr:Ig-like domain-containing protein [Propionibacteriaceae bacterium]
MPLSKSAYPAQSQYGRRFLAVIAALGMMLGSIILSTPAVHAAPGDEVVTTWDQLRAAISNPAVTTIYLGSNIQRVGTATSTDLPAVNRTLTIDGQSKTLDFRAGGTTTVNRRGFELSGAGNLTVTNLNLYYPNTTAFIAGDGQTVSLHSVMPVIPPNAGLAILPTGTVNLSGRITWESESTSTVVNASKINVTGTDSKVSLKNHPSSFGTSDDSPTIVCNQGASNIVSVTEGAHLAIEARTSGDTQTVYMNRGAADVMKFVADGVGTNLDIRGYMNGTGPDGGIVTMVGRSGGFQVTGGAVVTVHAALRDGVNSASNGMPAVVQQIPGGLFLVDGEGSKLNIQSDGAGNDLAGAVRIRSVGDQVLQVSNLGELNVLRTLRQSGGHTPSAIRFGTGVNNTLKVTDGGLIRVENQGTGTIATQGRAGNNGGIEYAANGFTFDVSGSKVNSTGQKIPSTIEVIAAGGPAVAARGMDNGSISVRDGGVFVARGNVNSDSEGIFSAGRNFTFTTDSPLYYDFANTNIRTGALVFSIEANGASYTSHDTDIAVWGNGTSRVGGSANTTNSSFNSIADDPYRSWTLVDFTLSGANFGTLGAANDPTLDNTVSSFGSRGMVPYHRVSGNNAAPIIRGLTEPTNADLYVRAWGTVPEGLDFYGRPIWTNEVFARFQITHPDGLIGTSVYGQISSVEDESLYTVEQNVKRMDGTVRYTNGKLLVPGTTYQVVQAWRGGVDNPMSDKIHMSEPDGILTNPVTVTDVLPPVPAVITAPAELLIGDDNRITGTWLTQDKQAAKEPHNPDPAVAISAVTSTGAVLAEGTLNPDGTWLVDIPESVTTGLSSGDKVYLVLKDGQGNANPLVSTPIHDTTKPEAPSITAVLAKIIAEDFTITAYNATAMMNAGDRDARLISLAKAQGRLNDSNPLSATDVEVVSVAIPNPVVPGIYEVKFHVKGAPTTPNYYKTILATVTEDVFSVEKSTFTVTPVVTTTNDSNWKVANGTDTYTGTLTAKDTDGNPMANLTGIQFEASSGEVVVSTIKNEGNGIYTVTFSTSKADPGYTAKVTVLGTQVGANEPIPFKVGELSQSKSTFEVTPAVDPNDSSKKDWVLVSEGAHYYTGTLTAKDEAGNALKNLALTDIMFSASSDKVALTSVVNNGDGTYTVQYSSKVANPSVKAALSYKGTQIGATKPIPFKAGQAVVDPCDDPSKPSTGLIADPTSLPVGEVSDLTVLVVDKFCNPVEGEQVTITIAPDSPAVLLGGSGTTDSEGKLYATLTDTKSEDVLVTAKIAAGTVPQPTIVTFREGGFSHQKSTFEVTPVVDPMDPDKKDWVVVSEGVHYYTGTIRAFDSKGNSLKDLDVADFSFTPSSTDVSVTSVVNNKDGTYSVQFSSKVADASFTATGSYGGDQVGTATPIPFKAGTPTPECTDPNLGSRLSADPTSLKVNEVSTLTAVVRDQFCNLVVGHEVTFTVDQSTSTTASLSSATAITNDQGIAEVTVTDSTSGQVMVSSKINNDTDEILDSPQTITFEVDSVDANKSTVTVNPTTQTAGQNVVITTEVRDGSNNRIPGLTVDQFVVIGTSDGLPDMRIPASSFTETSPGVYTFTGTSEKVGVFTVQATVAGVVLDDKPTVTFTAGGVAAATSSFVMVDNNALADGSAQNSAKAIARDVYGNPVPDAVVVMEDKSTGDVAGFLAPAKFEGKTGADGTVMIYWTSTKRGIFTAEGTIDGLRPTTGVLNQITFTLGAASAQNSEMVVTPASPITVGNSYTVTATVRDANGLLLDGERVEFALNPGSSALLTENYCVTNALGRCTVGVTSKLVTSVEIHGSVTEAGGLKEIAGNGDLAKASPQTVAFTHGVVCLPPDVCEPVDPTHVSRVEVMTPGVEANGKDANVALAYAYDKYGNPVPGVSIASTSTVAELDTTLVHAATQDDGIAKIEYRSTLAGGHDAGVTLDGRVPAQAISYGMPPRDDGQITLNFGSGTAVAANSTLAISPTTSQVVGSTFTVTATLRDATMNPVEGTTITFPAIDDLGFSPQASCVSGKDGTCQVAVTSTVAKTYEIIGMIGNDEVSNRVSAEFTPDVICTEPTCLTRVEVTTNGQKADGSSRNIATVYAFDRFDNPIRGLPVTSAPTKGTTGLTVQPSPAVTDANGMSTIWYTATATGTYDADVTVDGVTPQGSPVTLFFSVGKGKATTSEWDISPAGPLVVGQGTESTYTATATVRDEDRILVPGEVVTFAADPDGPVIEPKLSCMTDTMGTCSVTIYSTKAGTYSITARITDGSLVNVATGDAALSRAWTADKVCSQAENCQPEDPNLDEELRTRIVVKTNGVVADGVSRNEIVAWGFDKWGNPVVGARVESTSADKGLTIMTGIKPLGLDGSSTIWYTSTTAKDYAVDVKIDDHVPVDSPATLTFIPGEISNENSSFTVYQTDDSQTTVVADGVESWTGELYAVDASQNPIPNLSQAQINGLVWGVTPTGLVTISAVENIGEGYYTVKYTTTKAGTYTASLSNAKGAIGGDETIEFVTGRVSDQNSSITVNPSTQIAGSPVTITIVAKDAHNNPVADLTADDIQIIGESVAPLGLTTFELLSGPQTTEDGVYVYTATSKKIGDFEVSGVVGGTLLTQKPTVTFTAGGVCVERCEETDPLLQTRFEMVANNQLANGTSKDSARAYAFDTYGNAVAQASVHVEDKTTTPILVGKLTPPTHTVSTGTDGTVLVEWTSTVAGVYIAEGTIDNLRPLTGVMSSIVFTGGEVDAAKSEIVVTPNSPIVVGNQYTVAATVRGTSGAVLENEMVSFSLNPTTPASLSSVSCMTDAHGTCSITVRSEKVATVKLRAMVSEDGRLTDVGGNGDSAKASPKSLEFIAGSVCIGDECLDPDNYTRAEVVIDGLLANGTAADVVQVWAYDQYGNPVSGVDVTSTTVDKDLIILDPIPVTDSQGVTLVEYRSMVLGAHVAKVLVNGQGIPARSMDGTVTSDGTLTVNFASLQADPAKSFLTIDPAGSQEVGSIFTVTAHLRDRNDNPAAGSVVNFPAITNLGFSQASCTSGADGTCTVTVTSTKVSTYTVVGRLGVSSLSNTVDAQFTPGSVCIADGCLTRVEVTINGVEANGVDRDVATVYVYDAYDNPIPAAVISSTPVPGAVLGVQPNIAATAGNGTTTIWYTSTQTGDHKADVRINGTIIPPGSPITLSYGTGDGDPGNSSFVVTPVSPLVVGTSPESTYTVTATIKDSTKNAVPGAVVSFAIDPNKGPVLSGQSCTTDSAGVCSVTIHSTKSGTHSLTASIVAGAIKDAATGKPAASIAWRADDVCSEVEGCIPVDPDLPPELRTRIEVTQNNRVADGAERDIVTVYGFDQYGNPVVGGLVTSTTRDPDLRIQSGISALDHDGKSTIWYTSTVAGDHIAEVFVDDVVPKDAPATLSFIPGGVCIIEAGCVPVGPGTKPENQTRVEVSLDKSPVGLNNEVTAYAFDKYGNPVQGVDFDFVKSVATDDLVIDARCTTGTGGTCVAKATSFVAGPHDALASVKGTNLEDHGSPMTLTFIPGEICITEDGCVPDGPAKTDPSLHTRAEVLENYSQLTVVGQSPEKHHLNNVGVYAFDKYGNPVGGEDFELSTKQKTVFFPDGKPDTTITSSHSADPDIVTAYSHTHEENLVNVAVKGVDLPQLTLWYLAPPTITVPSQGALLNDRPVTVSGTATDVGKTVYVKDADGEILCQADIRSGGAWSCAISFGEGTHTILAFKDSPDGQKYSEDSDPVTFTVDTVPPNPPKITGPTGEKPINNPRPPITGTGEEPGNSITVTDENGNVLCEATVLEDLTWSCTPTTILPDGEHTVSATETDKAGNVSQKSDPVVIVINTKIPKPIVVPTGGTSLPQVMFPLGMILAATMVLVGLWVYPKRRHVQRER